MIDSTATSSLQLQILEANQNILEQKFELSNQISERISSQIEIANYSLGIIALFFTIMGLALAWYINDSYKKINLIKRQIQSTKNYIDKHDTKLYERLKRNDTEDMLRRLINVPEDIYNLQSQLFARDLVPGDFLLLKKAFLSENLDRFFKKEYILVFQQHFPCESLKDIEVRDFFLENLTDLKAMLERDMKNLFKEVIKFLHENNFDKQFKNKLLQNLFLGLYFSEHKNLISEFKIQLQAENLDVPEIITIAGQGSTDVEFSSWLNT